MPAAVTRAPGASSVRKLAEFEKHVILSAAVAASVQELYATPPTFPS